MQIPNRPIALALIALLTSLPAVADHLEELVVTASHDTRTIDVSDELSVSPDVTQLRKEAPGADVNSNGPHTGNTQSVHDAYHAVSAVFASNRHCPWTSRPSRATSTDWAIPTTRKGDC